jgi:hypothetical protein
MDFYRLSGYKLISCNGYLITFDELIQLSANYTPPKKEKAKKPAKRAVKKKK